LERRARKVSSKCSTRWKLLLLVTVVVLMVTACGATPEPQVVKETVVVTEKETVVVTEKETVVVTEKEEVEVSANGTKDPGCCLTRAI
jgi:uncharacterized protein YcfL